MLSNRALRASLRLGRTVAPLSFQGRGCLHGFGAGASLDRGLALDRFQPLLFELQQSPRDEGVLFLKLDDPGRPPVRSGEASRVSISVFLFSRGIMAFSILFHALLDLVAFLEQLVPLLGFLPLPVPVEHPGLCRMPWVCPWTRLSEARPPPFLHEVVKAAGEGFDLSPSRPASAGSALSEGLSRG
ncbi:MAG: hypothetical protein MZV63_34450 [Marinilabiliales bacterium]|nr:hypothetical protein [Marinilabiliales bacterium]